MDRATNGRYRTRIRIQLNQWELWEDHYNSSGQLLRVPVTYAYADAQVRAYIRTLGIWYYDNRTISCNFKIAIDYHNGSSWLREYHNISEPGKTAQKLEYRTTFIVYAGHIVAPFHIGGSNSWGKIHDTEKAEIKCNTGLF